MLAMQRMELTLILSLSNDAGVVFAALEVGQHAVPIPTAGPQGGPIVVVARHAADVAHRVDRAGTTQHFATRPPHHAMVELGFGRGVVIPVDALLAYELGKAGR